ncbi:CHAT domain-containing protein [Nostoc sp. T09]|uniref:CHAT domain-containing protein n=1 Tax=Nostoc sp. T09 TaxID=1932621 RepID=UPI001C4E52E7|nr:CHAT domain-containing protein [Nostoc sp. T09]
MSKSVMATTRNTESLVGMSAIATEPVPLLAQTQSPSPLKDEADRFLEEGRKVVGEDKLKSKEALEKALVIYRQIGDRDGEEDTLHELGDVYRNLEKPPYPKAVEFYRQALAIAQQQASSRRESLRDWTKNQPISGSCEYEDYIHPKLLTNSKRYIRQYRTNLILDKQEEAFRAVRQILPVAKQFSFSSGSEHILRSDLTLSSFSVSETIRRAIDTNDSSYPNIIQNFLNNQDLLKVEYDSISMTWLNAIILKIFTKDMSYFNNYLPIEFSLELIKSFEDNNYPIILETSEKLIGFYKNDKNYLGEFSNRLNLWNVYRNSGNSPKEVDSAKRMVEMARQLRSCSDEINALRLTFNAYTNLKNYPEAIKYAQQQLFLAQKLKSRLGNPNLAAEAFENIGDSYFKLGDYNSAIQFYQQQLSAAQEKVKEPLAFSNPGFNYVSKEDLDYQALFKISETYLKLSQKDKAIDSIRQSVELGVRKKNCADELAARERFANLHFYLGSYAQAIDQAEKSLEIIHRDSENCVKEYAQPMGELARSTDSDDGSVTIEIPRNDFAKPNAVSALTLIANSYGQLGNYQKMHDYAQQALAEARKSQDLSEQFIPLALLSNIYMAVNPNQAIEYLNKMLLTARKINNYSAEFTALQSLGFSYFKLDNVEKGKQYLQRALTRAREAKDHNGEMQVTQDLAVMHTVSGNLSEAQKLFQEVLVSLKAKGQSPNAGLARNLGILYTQLGDYAKGIEYLEQAIAISQQSDSPRSKAEKLIQLGYALHSAGKTVEAEKQLFSGINLLESLRTGLQDADYRSLFETQLEPYIILQQVLVQQDKTEQALEISERGRARAFVELLARRFSSSTEQVAILTPNIEQIKQIAKTQNATLVEYSITGNELFIWVIQPSGKLAFRRSSLHSLGTNIADMVEKLRVAVTTGRNRGTLKQTYQLLIQPIADLLPTDPNAHVVIIPHNSLFLVPFAALQDQEGKYLIEKHTIFTAPSIQVLALTHQKRHLGFKPGSSAQKPLVVGVPRNAVVIGNPIMPFNGTPPQQLDSLPGAEEEAKEVAKLFGTQAILGKVATKEAILKLLPKAQFIHFATHGIFDSLQGLESAIALAPSGKDSGWLTAKEILNLKLNAELAVLSACDTGRGEITGDGVIGLSRSLISAGVPSVIVSLWSVPDAPTAGLMKEFYQHLQHNPDKAQALRQAMLSTMKQYPSPRDWAAFTLIGEAQR